VDLGNSALGYLGGLATAAGGEGFCAAPAGLALSRGVLATIGRISAIASANDVAHFGMAPNGQHVRS
jgi:hypothetical protein